MKSSLEIILEARKKSTEIKPEGNTDYTEEVEDEEPTGEEETIEPGEGESDDPEPTDYTEEDPEGEVEDTNDEPDTVEDEQDDTLEPTDYTAENPEGEEGTGDEPTDGEDPTGEEDDTLEPTDYTSEETPEDGADIGGSDETGSDETSTEESTPEEDEAIKNKELFYDYIELYDLIKNFINKLSSQSKTTIFVNKIMIQINKNLNETRKSIWNYIMSEFDRNNYVTNLAKYNFFIENIRINIEMVNKVKDYVSKSETFK